jgi:response regulator RpfG family c-di-GMP phosphodiesterase
MLAKLLFVDDEDIVLKAVIRFFRDIYDVRTVNSADAALQMLIDEDEIAAVVVDLRMPGMSGVDFLRHARELAPQTTRVLLTGRLDVADAVAAVNDGHVFKLLVKPCPVATMKHALDQAVCHYQSNFARKAIVEDSTRDPIVNALCKVLATACPAAHARGKRIKDLAVGIAVAMGIQNRWEVEAAALLSQFGCIGIAPRILASLERGDRLSERDLGSLRQHPAIAAGMLDGLQPLRSVVRAVEYQATVCNETRGDGGEISTSARIVRAAADFDLCTAQRRSAQDALAELAKNSATYGADVLKALSSLFNAPESSELMELNVDQILVGMTLECAVGTIDGRTLLAKGSRVTESMLARLRAFARNGSVVQPILVSGVLGNQSSIVNPTADTTAGTALSVL